MKSIEHRQAAQITDGWWDEFVTMGAKAQQGPEMASTIRVVHRLGGVPEMNPAFADELGQQLDGLARRTSGRHRGGFGLPRPSLPTWSSPALLILAVVAIVGGFFGINSPGQLGEDSSPQQLAAPMSTPNSTPLADGDSAVSSNDSSGNGQMPGPAPTGMPEIAWETKLDNLNIYGVSLVGERIVATVFEPETRTWIVRGYNVRDGSPGSVTSIGTEGKEDNRWAYQQADDRYVYLLRNAELSAIDGVSGQIRWSLQLETTSQFVAGEFGLANGKIYYSAGNKVVALDSLDGSKLWEIELKNKEHLSTPVAAEGTVFVSDWSSELTALDAVTGDVRWTYGTKGIGASPIVINGLVAITSTPSASPTGATFINTLDLATGKPVRDKFPVQQHATLSTGAGILFISSGWGDTGWLSAIDIASGDTLWDWNTGSFITTPLVVGDQIFFSNYGSGTTTGLNLADGSLAWQVYLGRSSLAAVVDSKAIVFEPGKLSAVTGDGETFDGSTPDLSGLGPCTPYHSMPQEQFLGQPDHQLGIGNGTMSQEGPAVAGRTQIFMLWGVIKPSEIPTTPASNPEEAAAIQETLRDMNACKARPEAINQQQGFFSDDFYRRGNLEFKDGLYQLDWTLGPGDAQIASLAPIQLEDGRIAAQFDTDQEWDVLIVFVEQDGHWLIDEVLAIEQ